MFGNRNKKEPEKKKKRDLSAYGIFDGTGGSMDNDSEGGDSDLEAELAAITAGAGGAARKPKSKKLIPTADLDQMVSASLRDIDSDVDEDDNDDADFDDPELLNELANLTGNAPDDDDDGGDGENNTEKEVHTQLTSLTNQTPLLKSRIEMYKTAEANAKQANDLGRARRFNRALKTLQDLLKQSNAGKSINVDDIPPEVSYKTPQPQDTTTNSTQETNTTEAPKKTIPLRPAPTLPTEKIIPSSPPPPPPSIPAPAPPPSPPLIPQRTPPPVSPIEQSSSIANVNPEKITVLLERQKEYKIAALNAKKGGDREKALQFVKIIKLFDTVLQAARDGQPIDLSDMPPPPNELLPIDKIKNDEPIPSSGVPQPQNELKNEELPIGRDENTIDSDNLITPTSIMEALEQRLAKYIEVEKSAKDENNSGKARRMGRIVKQYQDAIKAYKAGKPVEYDDLPTPPGYGPIPTGGGGGATTTQPDIAPKSIIPKVSANEVQPTVVSPQPQPPRPPLRKQESRISGNHSATTVMAKTIELLLQRQKEFKDAAIEAKRAGDIEQAKEYFRNYKGFDLLLDTARGGLPVDLATIPIPPSQRNNLEDSFVHFTEADAKDDEFTDVSHRLEEQLQKQLLMCKTTRDHNKALGDVAGTNRYENLALGLQKDLDFVRLARQHNLPIPKFHYEDKSFNIVQCNTDLADSELEINVLRGIGYSVKNPKDIDTYVKFEFSYPQETPYQNRTQVIRNTDSPEYNEKFIAEIQPKARLCQRVFKRHGIKFEIYSKGSCWLLSECCTNISPMCCFSGFLRSDTLIGTVTVKLQPLENACELHDSFDLMDGRKTLGGKLEIKIRIRNPILTKQIQQTHEKWLIIDS